MPAIHGDQVASLPSQTCCSPCPLPRCSACCRSLVVQQAEGNGRFASELGTPLQAGPWYNSSVAISNDGHVATVTLPVRGSQRSSDVTVRVR